MGNKSIPCCSIVTIIITLIALLGMVLIDNTNTFFFWGIIIILSSLNLIIKCRKTSSLFYLVFFIGFVNLNIAIIDCFFNGLLTPAYQLSLRHSEFGLTYIKCFTLIPLVLDILLSPSFLQREEVLKGDVFPHEKNTVISVLMLLISFVVTITQFNGGVSSGVYTSNSNALYEYVGIFVIVGLLYSGFNKYLTSSFLIVSIINVLIGIRGGDRSSGFILLVLWFLYLFKDRIGKRETVLFVFAGIIASNFIGVVRSSVSFSFISIIKTLIKNGWKVLFSDTISFSFYSGITIVGFSNTFTGNRLALFARWVATLLFGGGSSTDLALLTQRNYMYNGGGGLYPAPFYFYGGYIGVVLFSIVLALIIRKVYSSHGNWCLLMRLLMIAFMVSWYVYSPQGLFRTLLVNFTIVYCGCVVINRIMKRIKR